MDGDVKSLYSLLDPTYACKSIGIDLQVLIKEKDVCVMLLQWIQEMDCSATFTFQSTHDMHQNVHRLI